MMFRPRALNMNDFNVLLNEKPMNGALVDFGTIMFLVGKQIIEKSPNFENRQENWHVIIWKVEKCFEFLGTGLFSTWAN